MAFYITTTLPYVNGKPHIGHALEFVQADVIARYQRGLGKEVFFNLGVDEHGLKVYTKALAEGKTPGAYTDDFADEWKEFCALYNISYDNFYRTSSKEHYQQAQAFWRVCQKAGYIYKKKYEGLYCVGCESFKTSKELVEGRCPDHQVEPEFFSEENYFFRLSAFCKELGERLAKDEWVQPSYQATALARFFDGGLEDISISRLKENLPWGVPVFGDESQVMYVWFDALTNYVIAAGWGQQEERFNRLWPGVQICGPDNLRFQGAIWQGMLLAAGLPPTKKLLVHGMVLAEDGTKMSKSVGNVVSPFSLAEHYPIEAVRYYLVAGIQTFHDSSFVEGELQARYRSQLQHNFGNLLHRVVTLMQRKGVEGSLEKAAEAEFQAEVDARMVSYHEKMLDFCLSEAMALVEDLGNFGNQYIVQKAPWSKDLSQEEIGRILQNLYYLLGKMVEGYRPVLPVGCQKAALVLENLQPAVVFEPLEGFEG